jgi:hypothetical protein
VTTIWTAATAFLLALTLFRVHSLLLANVWLWQHGKEYALRVTDLTPEQLTDDVRWEAMASCGGDYFPFGVKSNRIARLIGKRGGPHSFRGIVLLCGRAVWVWNVFVPMMAMLLVIYSTSDYSSRGAAAKLLLVTSFVLLAAGVLMSSEAVLAYANVRSWGASYHGFGRFENVSELGPVLGAAFVIVVSASVNVYTVGTLSQGWPQISGSTASRISSSIYFAFLGLIQDAPLTSAAAVAKASTALIALVGICFILSAVGLGVAAITSPQGTGIAGEDVVHPPQQITRRPPGDSKLWLAVAALGVAVITSAIRRRRKPG